MRPLALLALLAGCSKSAPLASPPPPVVVPIPFPMASAGPRESSPASAVHAIRLGDEPMDPEMSSPLLASIQPGEVPGAGHPAGTAYVAEPAAGPDPVIVTEWDLERGTRLRRIGLSLPKDDIQSNMVRAGDRLYVTAAAWNGPFAYVELTSDLRIVRMDPVVGKLYPASIVTPRADRDLVAMLWTGIAPSDPPAQHMAFALATWDASGHRTGLRYADFDEGPFASDDATPTEDMVVLGGKVFVLLFHQAEKSSSAEVVRLDRNLHIEKRATVWNGSSFALRLRNRDGRLVVVDTGESPAPPVELSTDLARLPASPPTDDSRWPGFGDETVTLCRGHDMVWIGWIRGPGDPCSAPPAR